jgi:hypothetical protein
MARNEHHTTRNSNAPRSRSSGTRGKARSGAYSIQGEGSAHDDEAPVSRRNGNGNGKNGHVAPADLVAPYTPAKIARLAAAAGSHAYEIGKAVPINTQQPPEIAQFVLAAQRVQGISMSEYVAKVMMAHACGLLDVAIPPMPVFDKRDARRSDESLAEEHGVTLKAIKVLRDMGIKDDEALGKALTQLHKFK